MNSSLQPKPIAPKGLTSKRKATETEAEDDEQHSRKKSMRKKALRACLACQRAHLTCDDARPCTRCQQRSTECVEGHRKKAKYLLDDNELEQIKRGQTSTEVVPNPSPSVSASDNLNRQDSTIFDPNFLPFGSEAANLEYSILSAILGSPDSSNSPPSQTYPAWNPAETIPFVQSSYSSTFGEPRLPIQPSDPVHTQASPATGFLGYPFQDSRPQSDLTDLQLSSTFPQADPLHPLQPRYPLDMRPRSPPTAALFDAARDRTTLSQQGPLSPSSKLQSINDRVTKPYDYTQGYHFLMKHLTSRFEKNDILRIVRALAIFRPSLIALQMPLSLDDEIFVEKCFQRSLLELDKLISFSGTPTVVWRRTGEICLVAPEFCVLTGWSKEELVGQKKYIYELFENQSVVEYWENFASHAFENTTQSVYSHCVLLKPSGAPVPSTFCFSIRRDLFDLPSIVIGQWLPLL